MTIDWTRAWTGNGKVQDTCLLQIREYLGTACGERESQ
jgi:hypothetical protein